MILVKCESINDVHSAYCFGNLELYESFSKERLKVFNLYLFTLILSYFYIAHPIRHTQHTSYIQHT